MVPFGTIAEPLRRAARDLARSLGKAIELELRGQETELDRGVLEQVADPLLHLVRNAIDHGVELPEARLAAGKPRYGTVRVHATQLGSEVVITVADDGQGIDLARVRQRAGEAGDAMEGVGDDEAIYAIFRSGLSTAARVSEVSGRGVGLDVVRASLASVRGRVEVHSDPGAGSEFRLSVPITLAVLPCLLVEAAGRRFAVPMHSVVTAEAAGWSEDHVEGQVVIRVRDTILPVSDLAATLGITTGDGGTPASDSPAVVVASMTRRHAFRVDALLGQRNLVVKDLGRLLPRLPLLAGASLEPDGSILLVLDVSGLVDRARWARWSGAGERRGAASGGNTPPRPPEPAAGASVLVVDDTTVVRELERSILEEAGYRVRTAADGRLALAALADTPADLVLTDVEMPNCDGLELTRAIRADPGLTALPVVVVTSRASDADRRLAMEAGADAYLAKGELDRRALLEVVGRLLGQADRPGEQARLRRP
jgi:two-component system chemotaxis sensor kinase CheA